MKKQFSIITASILTVTVLVFTGCSKDDTSAPDVTLNGGDQTIVLEGTYTELGATAKDDKDGEITPTISGTVNTKQAGVYTITYSATDGAGNTGEATRNVTVRNEAANLAGDYSCTIGTYTYTQTITASSTKNGRILFSKFGDYAKNTTIYADVVKGADIYLPSQTTPIKVGTPPDDAIRIFVGKLDATGKAGIVTSTGFSLSYDETVGASTKTFAEVFTKK